MMDWIIKYLLTYFVVIFVLTIVFASIFVALGICAATGKIAMFFIVSIVLITVFLADNR